MAIIALVSGSYCGGDEVITRLSDQLNYQPVTEQVFEKTARDFDLPREHLVKALSADELTRSPQSKDAIKAIAYLEATLADAISGDDVIVSGCLGFLIPGNISHILRVCLAADVKLRTGRAVAEDSLPTDEAQKRIHDYDRELSACTTVLRSKTAYDSSLYDLVIPMGKTTPAEAAELVAGQAGTDALKTTDWSTAQVKDFILSAQVKVALVEAGHRVEVFSERGHVIITVNEQALRMGHLKEKLKHLASEIDGVTEVTTKLGPKFRSSGVNPWESMDTGPKVLLVDDEREFVQTMSERLKTRNLESSIAYDGEQALDMIESEVPDVIVLDLLMPGIDGIETLRRIKRGHPEVEVIILTGHGSDREQAEAEDLGAFAYLRKPVNINELARTMKQAYARRQKHG